MPRNVVTNDRQAISVMTAWTINIYSKQVANIGQKSQNSGFINVNVHISAATKLHS